MNATSEMSKNVEHWTIKEGIENTSKIRTGMSQKVTKRKKSGLATNKIVEESVVENVNIETSRILKMEGTKILPIRNHFSCENE